MATATERMLEPVLVTVLKFWDWPNVPGSRFRSRDRRRLRTLSLYFTAIGGIAAAAASVSLDGTVAATIGFSAIGVIAGHYVAGVVIEVQRRSRERRLSMLDAGER